MKKLTIAAVVVGATAVTVGLALYGLKRLAEDFENCDLDDDIFDECADCDSDCENCTCQYPCNCDIDDDIEKEYTDEKKSCDCGPDCACEGNCDETCDCKEDCDCKKETEE